MSSPSESLLRALSRAHADALRVRDSPLQADRLADRLPLILRELQAAELDEDTGTRIRNAVMRAEQALRRDDDGQQAAKHLKEAVRMVEGGTGSAGQPLREERAAPWEEGGAPRVQRKAPWED